MRSALTPRSVAALHGAIAISFALTSVATVVGAQVERKSLSGSDVAIFNLAGRMTVEIGSGSDVVVEITRGGRDGRALRIESGQIGSSNTLRVLYPSDDIVYPGINSSWGNSEMRVKSDGTWGSRRRSNEDPRVRISSRGRGVEAWADIRIFVPAGHVLDAHLGVGELIATRVSGALRLESSAGRVIATGSRGSLTIDVGSGGVNVRDAHVDQLNIDAGSGGVTVDDVTARVCKIDTGSGGVTGDRADCRELHVDAGSGSVRLDAITATEVRVETGSGGVQLTMRNSPNVLNVEAGSGGVTIGLPATASAVVDIESGSGGIETEFPLRTNRVDRNKLSGTIGDGLGRFRIETGSGRVRLRRN